MAEKLNGAEIYRRICAEPDPVKRQHMGRQIFGESFSERTVQFIRKHPLGSLDDAKSYPHPDNSAGE